MGTPRQYLMGITTSASWMKRCSSLWGRTPFACTNRLLAAAKKRLLLNNRLAKLNGFSRNEFEPGKTYIADEPHRLVVCREICVHLAEISTSENLHNARPSTQLRSVPVENERMGMVGQRHSLSCKRLELGANPQLSLTVLNVNGKKVKF